MYFYIYLCMYVNLSFEMVGLLILTSCVLFNAEF